MNTETGELIKALDEEIEQRADKEKLVILDELQYMVLSNMNREGRRKYYKKHRKEFKWPKWEDINNELKQPRKVTT